MTTDLLLGALVCVFGAVSVIAVMYLFARGTLTYRLLVHLMPGIDVLAIACFAWGMFGGPRNVLATVLVLAVGISVLVLNFVYLGRSLAKQISTLASSLSEQSRQVASAAAQVSSSSQSLAQGASEQAASLEETSASAEEISSITRQNNGRSQKVAQLMNEAIAIVNAVNVSHQGLATALTEMSTSNEKVAKVVRMIDEIAFQTNILALNAAVEAARAGESGMGFAVVADEVRNLAHRSAGAAKDTADLIEEALVKSRESRHKLDDVLKSMDANNKITQAAKVETDEIRVTSEEQARGIEQIAKAITQMDQVTQGNAANAEEAASAAEELNAQSEAMKEVVERLTAIVGGGKAVGR